MICIPFSLTFAAITALWVFTRAAICFRRNRCSLKRELQLLLVYVCIVVVVRFTFFPFGTVDGAVQPLEFDMTNAFPPRFNLVPLVYLFDYPTLKEALINVIGNTLMFLPLGIVWPAVFKELDTHKKAIAAGFGSSLVIEILQLPFYSRLSDIDDLILNTLGYLMGYGIYLLVKALRQRR